MTNTIKKSNELVINIKKFSSNILKNYLAAFFYIIKSKKIKFKMQPTKYKKLTILRSPHKYKRAQEHYQLKIYKNTLIIKDVNISELLILLTNKPQGVFINIKVKQIN
jgi:ribosomal protein S10